ncbi:hypothetical protein [Paractinoplanes atraurantiacus]|uniref:Uncharacterized protein n=1 Tax=Paractinoplanes atraurantiacus TaxID=1036182 RepID=A0A285K2W9_9ACTN|nr:hypothetical protein [Actinoplanes atraurantiacus]SNY66633.1 hypothetical protein SAMN05421748_13083 [Actinoplanes atraurantiacus]
MRRTPRHSDREWPGQPRPRLWDRLTPWQHALVIVTILLLLSAGCMAALGD